MSITEVLNADLTPVATMSPAELRRQRGRELASRSNIAFQNGFWTVPAQSQDGFYRVCLDPTANATPMCTCPDHEKTGEPCKHYYAVECIIRHEVRPDGSVTQTRTMTVSETTIKEPKRPTYRQAWKPYNAAAVNEKRRFQALLFELVKAIEEPPVEPKRGRPKMPLRDMIYAITYKVYSLFSSRRFVSDLEDVCRQGVHDESPALQLCPELLRRPRNHAALEGPDRSRQSAACRGRDGFLGRLDRLHSVEVRSLV